MTEPINVRRWLSEAVANERCVLPQEELPTRELDGQPIDFVAVVYAVLIALGNGKVTEPPSHVSRRDYDRAVAVVRELCDV